SREGAWPAGPSVQSADVLLGSSIHFYFWFSDHPQYCNQQKESRRVPKAGENRSRARLGRIPHRARASSGGDGYLFLQQSCAVALPRNAQGRGRSERDIVSRPLWYLAEASSGGQV